MKYLLIASALLSFLHLPATALELNERDLVSTENLYLQLLTDVSAQKLETRPSENQAELQLEYIDQYNRSLFTLGEVDVERKITLNGGGKDLNVEAFELSFHIAVNYTP